MITRREFLKTIGSGIFSVSFPLDLVNRFNLGLSWPQLSVDRIPESILRILEIVPKTSINLNGHLYVCNEEDVSLGKVHQFETEWNLERSRQRDKLRDNVPWGIVLHWFGDKSEEEMTVDHYLRGFNGLRKIEDYYTRTSAHFIVGCSLPVTEENELKIGIIQTQKPAPDGTPYLASHLQGINYIAHQERRQYFVRAYYQLSYEEPSVHSLLQDMYDGLKIDPNMRTIAIEIAGYDFDSIDCRPSNQKIANVLSVVWAVMKRYKIPACNILGHHEIQLSKSDPGKNFIALIRFLLGIKTLVDDDNEMKQLVFGQHLKGNEDPMNAVYRYFKIVRDYHVLVANPHQAYDWEIWSQYWFFYEVLTGIFSGYRMADEVIAPIHGISSLGGYRYINPDNHEGVDMYSVDSRHGMDKSFETEYASLVANGECLYIGQGKGIHDGQIALFRHWLPNGSVIVSSYGHLADIGDFKIGNIYPIGTQIGKLSGDRKKNNFLHFALAYGASWDSSLIKSPNIPLNVGPTWIRNHFLSPMEFLRNNNIPENIEIANLPR